MLRLGVCHSRVARGRSPTGSSRTGPNETRDFILGSMLRARQHLDDVLGGEVRAEHQEAGEVELAGGDRVEQSRKSSNQARCGDAPEGFVFRKPQLVEAVSI